MAMLESTRPDSGEYAERLGRIVAEDAEGFAQRAPRTVEQLRADLWSMNFRFGWLQDANTGLFVVYTDSNLMDDLSLGAQRFNPNFGRTDRSFTIKFSRMFDVLR